MKAQQRANELIADLARRGAEYGNLRKMCGECAFRLNSVANLEEHNAEAALNSVMWEGQFNCHVNQYENANTPCIGFQYARQYFEKRFANKTDKAND